MDFITLLTWILGIMFLVQAIKCFYMYHWGQYTASKKMLQLAADIHGVTITYNTGFIPFVISIVCFCWIITH